MYDLKLVAKALKHLHSKGFTEAKFSTLKGLNITAENENRIAKIKIKDGNVSYREESKSFQPLD